jgi:hypothetical protein
MPEDARFTVTCPCCGALISIDGSARVVVGHEPPPSSGEKASFEARMKTLQEEKRIAEEKFQESIRTEKSKKEVLEKKFQDLFQKAKEGPVGPMKRDIDLD